MAFYENTIIARQDLSEKNLLTVKNKYNDLISSSDGKVLKIENWGLLNLARKIKNYKIKNYPQHIPKGRAFQFLAKNQELDVIFGGASIERVAKNRAIHFPLIKGLNGWRVALIKANKHHTFLNTETVNELKTYSLGQSHSWSDSQILAFNGFNLIKGSSYKGMYQMLIRDRFDYFPRSVLEIQDDLNNFFSEKRKK